MKEIKYSEGTQNRGRSVEVTIGTDPRYKGNLEALREHPLYLTLTHPQQTFVEHYVQHRDKVAAARASGHYKSDHVALVAGSRYLRDHRIKGLVGDYFGFPPIEDQRPLTRRELLGILSQRIRSREVNDVSLAALGGMVMELQGWRVKGRLAGPSNQAAPDPPPSPNDPPTADLFAKVRKLEAKSS